MRAKRPASPIAKHACIRDGLAIDKSGRIVVSGSFLDPEVLSLAHHNLDQIEEWMRGYCDIDRRSAVPRLRVRAEPILRRLELSGAQFERLGVRMRKQNVIDLIASNAVWRSNLGAPVRELIQNAIEACRYRSFHSTLAAHYIPAAQVLFNRPERTIIVRDNGCGMSARVILNNLLTVGNSRATKRAYSNADYAPIARFGIGFWSVFTIARRAEIKTLAFEDSDDDETGDGIHFEVELSELKDYTVFRRKRSTVGTTVTLQLDPRFILDDIFEQTRKQLLCSEIELTLTLDGDEFTVPKSTPKISDEYLLDAKLSRKEELGIKTFAWNDSLGNTDLALGLAYRLSAGIPSFIDDSGAQVVWGSGPPRGLLQPQVAVCGFQTRVSSEALPFDVNRVGTYSANFNTPRGIEFSIDRQSVQDTRPRAALRLKLRN